MRLLLNRAERLRRRGSCQGRGRALNKESSFRGISPIGDNAGSADSRFGNTGRPVLEYNVECSDFERDKQSFIEEEVPASPMC